MKIQQCMNIDIAEAVSIGGEESVADMLEAGTDAVSGIGFEAGGREPQVAIGGDESKDSLRSGIQYDPRRTIQTGPKPEKVVGKDSNPGMGKREY